MKIKLIITLFLLTLSFEESLAQLRVGPTAGLQVAQLRPDNSYDDYSPIGGVHLGGTAEYRFMESIGGELGMILFTPKGASQEFYAMGGDVKLKTSITYLQIPLQFAYHLKVNDLRFVFKTGPYLAVALGARVKESGDNISTYRGKIDIGSGRYDIKRMDQGWNFGAGIDISEMGIPVQAVLGYALGLSNISNSGSAIRNRALTLSLTYFLFDSTK